MPRENKQSSYEKTEKEGVLVTHNVTGKREKHKKRKRRNETGIEKGRAQVFIRQHFS